MTASEPKAVSVSTVEAADELPEVTEEYVAGLSEEVRLHIGRFG